MASVISRSDHTDGDLKSAPTNRASPPKKFPPWLFVLTNIPACDYVDAVKLISIYKCLCDETRLRILNLLTISPLCVCHIQEILEKPQAKISQNLSYLKARGMVASHRHLQWMIYSLPPSPPRELKTNLKCLQDCVQTEPIFQEDSLKLKRLMGSKTFQNLLDEGCCSQAEPLPLNKVKL